MTDLCERLHDMEEAGVYSLCCPLDVLRANIELANLKCFEVDLSSARGKGEFLATTAKTIQAPDWFGHNLDALADSLSDLSWLDVQGTPAKGYVLLLLNGGETLGLSIAEHGALMQIFEDTVRYWKSEGRPFWVFFA